MPVVVTRLPIGDAAPRVVRQRSPRAPEAPGLFTRYPGTNCASPPTAEGKRRADRAAWLVGFEQHTRTFRAGRAKHHRIRAFVAPLFARGTQKWHEDRAKGQVERFERVASCGATRSLVSTCNGCGDTQTRPLHCGHHRLCVPCRGRRAQRGRVRLTRAIVHHVERLRRLGAVGWEPRMLTLTIPHSSDVRHDTSAIVLAWRRYWRLVESYLYKDRKLKHRLPWARVLEFTPGKDGLGHVHIHAILVAPYIPQPILSWLWARALPASYAARLPTRSRDELLALAPTDSKRPGYEGWDERAHWDEILKTRRGGKPLAQIPQGIVWIDRDRRKRGGSLRERASAIAAEASKYLTKDGEIDRETGELKLANEIIAARMYEAAEGHRTIQASRHWWAEDEWTWCCAACGAAERTISIEREGGLSSGATRAHASAGCVPT